MIFESGGVTAQVAYEAQVLKYCNVAAAAFLAYDLLINLGDEIELVWSARNTWAKWVYLYLRHYGTLSVGLLILHGNSNIGFTSHSCLNWYIVETVISNSVVLITESMLLIRVFAIYGKSKLILALLVTASVAEIITVLITTIKAFQTARVSLDLGCVLVYIPPILTAGWAASLGFQTIVFGLTILRWLTHLMVTKQLGRRSILYVFVRDGGWAYGGMFVVFLVNLLTFRLKTSPLAAVVFRWAMAMAAFTGSHILLNLRRLGSNLHEDFLSFTTTDGQTDFGRIVFAQVGPNSTMAANLTGIELESQRRHTNEGDYPVCPTGKVDAFGRASTSGK